MPMKKFTQVIFMPECFNRAFIELCITGWNQITLNELSAERK